MGFLCDVQRLAAYLVCIAACFCQLFTPVAAADLTLEARRIVGEGQGVRVETADGRVLVSEAGSHAVHPASVSKLPTTLALLRELGPDYRFETEFLAGGPIQAGVLEGPLVVRGSGDPYFVDENALVVAKALRQSGLRKVSGDIVVEGNLLFNWNADNVDTRLRRALGGDIPSDVWEAVRETEGWSAMRVPSLQFAQIPADVSRTDTRLITHLSQPLHYTLKALNGYSNNIFASFADAAGGIRAVEEQLRHDLPPQYRGELVLGDGAGAHPANRMSPRAAVAILRALVSELSAYNLDLTSVMPVAGIDDGTLRKRFSDPDVRGQVVAKTGTYGDYGACALAGALRTKDGLVYFAILNSGVPILEARRRQDAYVRVLMAELDAIPWAYQRNGEPAFARAAMAVVD